MPRDAVKCNRAPSIRHMPTSNQPCQFGFVFCLVMRSDCPTHSCLAHSSWQCKTPRYIVSICSVFCHGCTAVLNCESRQKDSAVLGPYVPKLAFMQALPASTLSPRNLLRLQLASSCCQQSRAASLSSQCRMQQHGLRQLLSWHAEAQNSHRSRHSLIIINRP